MAEEFKFVLVDQTLPASPMPPATASGGTAANRPGAAPAPPAGGSAPPPAAGAPSAGAPPNLPVPAAAGKPPGGPGGAGGPNVPGGSPVPPGAGGVEVVLRQLLVIAQGIFSQMVGTGKAGGAPGSTSAPEAQQFLSRRAQAASIQGSLGQLGLGRGTSRLLGTVSRFLPKKTQAGMAKKLSGLAEGPVGAIVELGRQLKEGIVGAIGAAGRVGGKAAALDTGGLADAGQGAVSKLPIFGDYLGKAVEGLRSFSEGLGQTANRLAPFSGQLAAAQAQAQVRQVTGDIRRSQMLGPELAQFVEAKSQLSQQGQDLLAKLMKPLIPIATEVLKKAGEFLKWLEPWLEGLQDIIINAFARLQIAYETTFGDLKAADWAQNVQNKIAEIYDEMKKGNDNLWIEMNTPLEGPDLESELEPLIEERKQLKGFAPGVPPAFGGL